MDLQMSVIFVIVCTTSVYGGKYDLYQDASSWEEARDACERDGKRLVTVEGHTEHVRIQNLRPFIDEHFWIGLRKEDSAFKWTDDTEAHFTAWGQGQPSSQSACVRYSADDYTWETHDCSASLAFMCENDVLVARESDGRTAAKGLLIGFGSMLSLLLIGILLLQLPCCRVNRYTTIGQVGLGTRHT